MARSLSVFFVRPQIQFFLWAWRPANLELPEIMCLWAQQSAILGRASSSTYEPG